MTFSHPGSQYGVWLGGCVAQDSGRAAEVDIAGLDRPGRPPRRRLVGPVQVRVRDDLVRRRRPPFRLIPRRVGVADEGRVVPPGRTHRAASSGCTHRSLRRPRRAARLRGPTARSRGWCPQRSRRSSSPPAARHRPEPVRGRSASRRFPSQAARRNAGPRQRGSVPAAPSRPGGRRSRQPRRARERPRRRRSARRRRGVRCSAGSPVWSWPSLTHAGLLPPSHASPAH